ncbi:High-affinity branched-chain amino acid transport system permease protein LivH [Pigmentiphaga humi]|uniref:High-affinity branched-chain amino acid transport system permease protein LivH n=1 Tax=Pigmentiphaga humi TaxID=2478468 RepID=A0A3P4B7U2_9BURK|nr:branched-chain amino acid ABC transporter permease [Pigmentiphaga humi]VCU72001.1 High-affinity branched-chain amino acid transport system permease protein LivH [Pigmentiphaga humi]
MEGLIVSVLNGLCYGLLLFMLSAGLTLVFSMMGIINFAHASFYMLGAYLAYAVGGALARASMPAGAAFWTALFLAPVLAGLGGAAVERFALRRLRPRGHVAELLFTFALAYVIVELVQLVWGRSAVPYRMPAALAEPLLVLGGQAFAAYRLVIAAVAGTMLAALWWGLKRTRIGLVVQAAIAHPDMAQALGHDVPRVFMLVFAAGCLLAALAGAIGGSVFVTDPGMAQALGPIVFVVTVVGGLGSLAGAFVASLLIGLVQTLAVGAHLSLAGVAGWLGARPEAVAALAAWPLSRIAPVLPYLLMVAVLVWRPRGLMGARET